MCEKIADDVIDSVYGLKVALMSEALVQFDCFTVCRVLMVEEEMQVVLETPDPQVQQDFQVHRAERETPDCLVLPEIPGLPDHQDHRDLADHPAGREILETPDLRDRPDLKDNVDLWVLWDSPDAMELPEQRERLDGPVRLEQLETLVSLEILDSLGQLDRSVKEVSRVNREHRDLVAILDTQVSLTSLSATSSL